MKERSQKSRKVQPKAPNASSKAPGQQLQARDPWQREMFAMARGGKDKDKSGFKTGGMAASPRKGIKAGEGAFEGLGFGKIGEQEKGVVPPKEVDAKAPADAKPENAAPKAIEPVITYETLLEAKEGGKVRTKVGVGEKVKFTANVLGDWTVSAGWPKIKAGTQEFTWTAPSRANSVTITFTADGLSTSVNMTVVEPEEIVTTRKRALPYPKGTSAAGMELYFDYKPFDVSFGRVEAGEKSGPASYITGYFKDNYTPAQLYHASGDHFTKIQANNRDSAADTAANATGELPPYKWGQFHWVIPNRFRVVGETGDGKVFTTVTQSFFINAKGGQSITKGSGAAVHRGMND